MATQSLAPPANGLSYPTLRGLIEEIQQHAVSQGYAVVIQRIKNNKKGEKRKAWLRCDRGGELEKNSKSLDKRATGSRLIKCPFKAIAMLGPEGWVLSVEDESHNHEPTLAGAHLSHRQNVLTTVVREEITNLSRSGCTPA